MRQPSRDHGGGLDAAIAHYGGTRSSWLDLSTGINPVPYPMPKLSADAWTALPDEGALHLLLDRARSYWGVPKEAGVLAAPGASALIAQIPRLVRAGRVAIPGPTYNEHGAAFRNAGWKLDDNGMDAFVAVHPNNPDGVMWDEKILQAPLTVIDESFCDVTPDASLIHLAARKGTIVLKSFGKFWGLAGMRLGFAFGDPDLLAELSETLGPWAVSGPAIQIGAEALADPQWADDARARLTIDANRLDSLLLGQGAKVVGGTTLFRLYEVDNAKAAQDMLAQKHVWSRVFPYADNWIRLGLPHPLRWGQLEGAF
jgi:cobalamin biosynthetic protein CobC